jgi:putative Holliday junction resolvase
MDPLLVTTQTITQLRATLPPQGRILAIDWGTVSVGLAMSDETRLIASPLAVYARKNREKDLAYLTKQVADWHICAVVFGLPMHMSGDMSELADQVVRFAEKLEPVIAPVPLYFYDERWTTQAVERQMIAADLSRKKRAAVVDKLAACYLLQGILDAL